MACAFCPTRVPTSSTAIASTGPTILTPDTASTPTRLSWIRTRNRSRVRFGGPTRCSATASGTPTRTFRSTTRDNAPFAPLAAVVDPAFTWGDDRPPRTAVAQHRHLRDARPRVLDAATPAFRPHLRGTYEALTTEPALDHLKKLGVTAVELMPVHHHARDRHLEENGADQLLGLQQLRLFRARAAVRGLAHPGRRGPRVQAHGSSASRGRPRGHPRRGLQPHGRGATRWGRRCRSKAIDNASYYRLGAGPALLHGLHRLRQHAEHAEPPGAAADHGQPALLGARDARRRIPLRPGERAGARALRRRSAGAVSSTSSTRIRCSRRSS